MLFVGRSGSQCYGQHLRKIILVHPSTSQQNFIKTIPGYVGSHTTLREPPHPCKKPTLSHFLCSALRGNQGCSDGAAAGGMLVVEMGVEFRQRKNCSERRATPSNDAPGCRPRQQSLPSVRAGVKGSRYLLL